MSRLFLRAVPPPIQSQLGGIAIQTSIYGGPIPLLYGRSRLSGNLLDYADFVADSVSGKNKGSKKGNVSYDYGSAIIIALCQGPVSALNAVWDNTGTLPVNDTSENYVVSGGSPSYTVTQQPTFISDLGVTKSVAYSTLANDYGSPGSITLVGTQQTPMELVSGSPGPGQYSQSGGTYGFNLVDAGATLQINYSYGPSNTLGVSDPIQSLGLTFFNGAQGQAPWAYMVGAHPAKARGYSLIAYVATPKLDEGTTGLIPNLSYEVFGFFSGDSASGDANPKNIIYDMTTDPFHGIGLPASIWGDLSLYSNFCAALGLFMSPRYDQQRQLSDCIKEILDATNSTIIRNGFSLQVIPYGDTTAVGNGATYTPPTDPIYDLGFDDFVSEPGKTPVTFRLPDVRDAKNWQRVNFSNRGDSYNQQPVDCYDQRSVDLFGIRKASQLDYPFFTSQAPASLSAQMALGRSCYIRGEYSFTLRKRFIGLNCMDLVTIPKGAIYGTGDATKIPVRLTSIARKENAHSLDMKAEPFPWGNAGPTVFTRQTGSGSGPNPSVDPGQIGAVAIIEALPRLRGTDPQMELWVGVSGKVPATWGGCHIWMSVDGLNYPSPTATLPVNSTIGILSAALAAGADPDATNTLQVIFIPGNSVASASQAAQNAFQSLMAVFSAPSIAGDYLYELVSFATSQDAGAAGSPVGPFTEQWKFGIGVAAGQYLRRGVFASPNESHPSGCPVLVLDGKVARIPFDPSMIGKPLYFKFTGFNVSGAMEQPLTLATAYTYTPTGQPGLFALTYSVAWDNPSNMLAQSGSSIIVNPFTIKSSAASPHYLGAGASGSLAGAITLDGSGAAIDPTKLYYLYVQDPNYAGENATLILQDVYEADLTPVRATSPGWFSLGSIQLSSGGSGSGGGDSGPDGGGGGGLTGPGLAD